MANALLAGPAGFRGQTKWPAWAVLPAAFVIFVLAALAGYIAIWFYSAVLGADAGIVAPGSTAQMTAAVVVWLAAMQLCVVLITYFAAGFFSSDRALTLSLVKPQGGWGIMFWALPPLFAIALAWTGLLVLWKPEIVAQDLRPFVELMQGDAFWLVMFVICIGAPLSEEILFRGFLFTGLAKTRLGFIGTSLVTTILWTSLHAGYSIFGLVEVLWIGLYFSWLIVRTGSLWVTMFCHAVYNTAVALALLAVTLPPPPAPVVP